MATPVSPVAATPVPLLDVVAGVEKELGAPPGSLVSLLLADDWSFIIRAHALIEGAISVLLSGVLDPRLRPVFNHLELGRADTGKLEFSKALEITTTEERRFITVLSRLRNMLAHDMSHLGFALGPYISGLDKQQRKSFYDSLMMNTEEAAKESWRTFMAVNPKLAMFAAVLGVMTKATITLKRAALDAQERKLALDYAEEQRQFWTNLTTASLTPVDSPPAKPQTSE